MTELDLQALKHQLPLAPLSITCPSCGSGPGKNCYGNGPMPYSHAQREPSTLPISTALALIARVEELEGENSRLVSDMKTVNEVTRKTVEYLKATIQRVRDYHQTQPAAEDMDPRCRCGQYAPCVTIQALEGNPND